MVKKPKSKTVSEEQEKVAKNLGVNLEGSGSGKDEKESNSSKKTDTEVVEEEGRDNKTEKTEKKEKDKETDYESLYKASSREVNEKFLPMQKRVEKLEEVTGKDIETLLGEASKPEETPEKDKKEKSEKDKKDTSKDKDEVTDKVLSLEEDINKIKEKVSKHDKQAVIEAKKKVESFREKYGVSESVYKDKIHPLLDGVSKMTKDNGDPYTLEEGLELAYLIANKDNIDNIVNKKIEIKEKEKEVGSFSPTGSKQSSSVEKPEFSEEQIEFGKNLGVDITTDEEKE